jgi:hypothetical protein
MASRAPECSILPESLVQHLGQQISLVEKSSCVGANCLVNESGQVIEKRAAGGRGDYLRTKSSEGAVAVTPVGPLSSSDPLPFSASEPSGGAVHLTFELLHLHNHDNFQMKIAIRPMQA